MTEFLLFVIAIGVLLQSKRGVSIFNTISESLGITFLFAVGIILIGVASYGIYLLAVHYWMYIILFSVLAIISATLLILSERFNWKII